MDIGRAFRAMFDDPAWVGKVLLALLFQVLVVTGPAVLGYYLQYIRNVAEGRDVPLPEWSGFGTYWVRGILVILAAIVYVIVGLLLFVIGIIPALITLQGAVIEYAMTGRAGSLFALGSVWRRITTYSQFWLAWILAIALGVAVSIVTAPFSAAHSTTVNAIGGILGVVLGLYVGIVSQHLYGQYARVAYVLAPSRAAPTVSGGYAPPPPSGGHPTPSH
jgi:hypothetical protein